MLLDERYIKKKIYVPFSKNKQPPKWQFDFAQKSYDHTKYQMAEVTESFEARMFASMKRQEEEELEDVLPPPHGALGTHSLPPHPPRAGPIVRASQQVCSESPYTTSDDDTSFSTWKAPVSCFLEGGWVGITNKCFR